jgi:two-component system chemotaxis response regulator CheB
MSERPLRVLVVDDTVVYRKVVSDVIDELPDAEVVGVAHDGKIAMSKIGFLKPDLLTLDIEMPEMNGLEVLDRIRTDAPDTGAVMLSTLTREGGEMTMRALELGAFDFIPKPETRSLNESKLAVKRSLGPILKAYARRKALRSVLKSPQALREKETTAHYAAPVERKTRFESRREEKSEIVCIGISTGGPGALARMLPDLTAAVHVPILIVQHMPPVFTQSLAKSLDAKCPMTVKEAADGEPVTPDTIFIAPGGKQMKLAAGADGKTRIIRITNDPPENSCKPSVDYLFRSVAHHYVGRATAVIMTGMGTDGTDGLRVMKKNGAIVIAQDQGSSTVYGMPKEAVDAGVVDVVSPLDRIAEEIRKTVQ